MKVQDGLDLVGGLAGQVAPMLGGPWGTVLALVSVSAQAAGRLIRGGKSPAEAIAQMVAIENHGVVDMDAEIDVRITELLG